jgi:hypothetical protein
LALWQPDVAARRRCPIKDWLGRSIPLYLRKLAGFALHQPALKTGFLAPAMAASNATTLAVSVLLGITLFEETISKGQGRFTPAIFDLILALIGVVLLATPELESPKPAAE